MRNVLILTLILIFGCERESAIHREHWKPSVVQALKAEETAKKYALVELGVPDTQLSKMKTKTTGWKIDATYVVKVSFYDTVHFPDWEENDGVRGGFPYYFTITLDTETETVVGHYASPE